MASERLYLRSVTLKSFRAFADQVTVELPPGPGVLVLVGPNGLGKSSFFEAIEIALTGGVRRWDETLPDLMPVPATARQGSNGTWAVSLAFADTHGRRTTVSRTGPVVGVGSDGTAASEVVAMLAPRPEDWSLSDGNLRAFLHSTHFLAQSPRLRFLAATGRDRWDNSLSHICGFDRIRRAQAATNGSKNLLTRRVGDRQAALNDARVALVDWDAGVARVSSALSVAGADLGLWDPSRVRAALGGIGESFLPGATSVAEEDARALLAQLPSTVDELDSRFRASEARIESARGFANELSALESAEAALVAETAASQRASAQAEASRREFDKARAEEEAARVKLVDRATADGRARSQAEAIGRHEVVHTALARATARLDASGEAIRLGEERVARLMAARDAARVNLEMRTAWENKLEAARARRRTVELLRDRVQAAEATLADATRRASDRAAILGEATALNERLDSERRSQRTREVDLQTMAAELGARRSRNDTLQQAVAIIAGQLDEHDERCPVCDAHHSPPILLEKARAAARMADPRLLELESRAASLHDEIARSERAIEALVQNGAELRDRISRIDSVVSGARINVAELLSEPLLTGCSWEEVASRLASEDTHVSGEIERGVTELAASMESKEVLATHTRDAEAALDTATHELRQARVEEAAAQDALDAAKRALDVHESALGDVPAQERSQQHLMELVDARSREVRIASELLQQATARVKSLAAQLELHARAQVDAEALALRARERARDLGQRGLTILGVRPTASAIEEVVAREGASIAQAKELKRLVETALAGLSRWLSEAERNLERDRLSVLAGGSGSEAWSAHRERLAGRVKECELAYERARVAREAVETLGTSLGSAVHGMRPILTKSLAAPLGALLSALIQDPRFHDVRLRIEGTDKKSAVSAPMREDGIEAEYLLSEGQLAGVSMALLLAMATTFRWSSWPALLLDDPGQNNDLIHVANLIEVLRTLVAKSGFQVVLSTHDSELAEFMVRKFRNARIAGATLRFRDPDPAVGVIPAVIPW